MSASWAKIRTFAALTLTAGYNRCWLGFSSSSSEAIHRTKVLPFTTNRSCIVFTSRPVFFNVFDRIIENKIVKFENIFYKRHVVRKTQRTDGNDRSRSDFQVRVADRSAQMPHAMITPAAWVRTTKSLLCNN